MLCSVVEENVRCGVWLRGWLDNGVCMFPEIPAGDACQFGVVRAVRRGPTQLTDLCFSDLMGTKRLRELPTRV